MKTVILVLILLLLFLRRARTILVAIGLGIGLQNLHAQATVYLRASGPPMVQVMGASNSGVSPMQICTGISNGTSCGGTTLAHNFPSTCGAGTTCYCEVSGLAVISGNHASAGNGIRQCHYVDTTHLSLYDMSGNPIAANGDWSSGTGANLGGAQTVSLLTQFLTNAGPTGYLDGPTGDTTRRLALTTMSGLSSLTVTGSPSAAVIKVTTSYDPTVGNFPARAGNHFSITGTGTPLDTCGDGTENSGPQSPYTMSTATSNGWVSNPFSCSGLTDGTYTSTVSTCGPPSTPNDTIGGTQSCTVVSQLATTANPWWVGQRSFIASIGIDTYPAYMSYFDGGSDADSLSTGWIGDYQSIAALFLVERSNSFWLTEILYVLNHVEREFGVNWSLTENNGNPSASSQYQGFDMYGLSVLYAVAYPYWAANEEATFRAKMYNNLNDPSVPPCSKTGDFDSGNYGGNPTIVASGTAAGGTSTTLTLQTEPGLGSCTAQGTAICGNIIQLGTVAPFAGFATGTITAYNNSTKVATVSAGWSGNCTSPSPCVPPSLTTPPYLILATAVYSSTAPGVGGTTATVTGYNTKFTSTLKPGDAILVGNSLGNMQYGGISSEESYVKAINSDTNLTVINSTNVRGYASITAPGVAYYLPQWSVGSCGRAWFFQHAPGYPGSQPNTQIPGGGKDTLDITGPAYGGNTSWFLMASVPFDLAVAAATGGAETRAVSDLALNQATLFDYPVRLNMNGFMGLGQAGATYDVDAIESGSEFYRYTITQSVPGYPSMDQTGHWATDQVYKHMFGSLPDSAGIDGTFWYLQYTAQSSHGNVTGSRDVLNSGFATPAAFAYWPATCATAPNCPGQYYRNFLETSTGYNAFGTAGLAQAYTALQLFHNSDTIASTNYKAQPLQYVFNTSSAARCGSLTGWPCPANYRYDAMISRSGWSHQYDTLVFHDSRSSLYDYYYTPDSSVGIYKLGWLLYNDFAYPGQQAVLQDMSVLGDTPSIGTYPASFMSYDAPAAYGGTPANMPIYAWAGGNHGSWPASYGDQNSNYAYDCADLSGLYNQSGLAISIDWMHRCVYHSKQSGGDEFVFDFHSYSASTTPTLMEFHLHYPNNGAVERGPGRTMGTTTYLGGGIVKSVESGGTVPGGSAPAQTYGLMSYIYSPDTITIHDDCAGRGGGQCAGGDTYSGGNGYSYRFTVSGGSTVGAPVKAMDVVLCHKVMQSLTDTVFNTIPINPDQNWTGIQCGGSTSSAVGLFARGGATQSAVTGFTTTHNGMAQYLLAGLTAGVYTVTVNGGPVAGSPFVVSDGDNSIEFGHTAGTVNVSRNVGLSSHSFTSLK